MKARRPIMKTGMLTMILVISCSGFVQAQTRTYVNEAWTVEYGIPHDDIDLGASVVDHYGSLIFINVMMKKTKVIESTKFSLNHNVLYSIFFLKGKNRRVIYYFVVLS